MMVKRHPNLKEEVGSSIFGCEIFSLLDKTFVRWSTVSCALALACRPSVSKKQTTCYNLTWYAPTINFVGEIFTDPDGVCWETKYKWHQEL